MFVPTPGTYMKTIPLASAPMERVFFANTDSVGPVSDIGAAVASGRKGAEWSLKRLAESKKSARTLALEVGARV
jgi:hypothetical protein